MSLPLRTWILCAVGFATLGLPSAVQRASADPVTIVGGTAGFATCCFGLGGGGVNLRGTDGFALDALSDNSHLGLCDPCQQGERAGLFATLIGDWIGTGSFRGRALDFSPTRVANAFGQIDVGGFLDLPSHADGIAQFTFPARISGSMHFNQFTEEGGGFSLDIDLAGSGIGTVTTFARNLDGVTFYELPEIVAFDFGRSAVTPEPTSLILLGSGLAVGCWQRRRRASVA